jgi:serine/threonine protein kinase
LLYFVMEYIEGADAQKLVAEHGALAPERALGIAAQICDALAYAHKRGVIHRDIKPSNIMVDAEGQVKVADFGLAKVASDDSSAELTGTHMRMGSPAFMAPEAMMGIGNADHRADLYSVGVTLYQMLTGRLPRGSFEVPSQRVPGLDARFDEIIDRALQSDPDNRYSSAVELRADLDRILAYPASPASPASSTTSPSPLTQTAPLITDGPRPNPARRPSEASEKPDPDSSAARRRGEIRAHFRGCTFSLAVAFGVAVSAGLLLFYVTRLPTSNNLAKAPPSTSDTGAMPAAAPTLATAPALSMPPPAAMSAPTQKPVPSIASSSARADQTSPDNNPMGLAESSPTRRSVPTPTAFIQHEATEPQREIAEKHAIAYIRRLETHKNAKKTKNVRYIAVDTEKNEHTSPKEKKVVMVWDTKSESLVGNTVYDLPDPPAVGKPIVFATYDAEYVAGGN